jgi:hypothetical protein
VHDGVDDGLPPLPGKMSPLLFANPGA